MNNHTIVMGAGALGLATAEVLLMQGAKVTLLERGKVGQESSWAGGGILSPLCPWDYPGAVTRLALRGAELFGDWAEALHQATGIDPEYARCGMLVLPPFDAGLAEQWCSAHGVACLLSPVGRGIEGEGLFLPEVAQTRNPRLLQAQQARVVQLGGRIVEDCEVAEVVTSGAGVTKLATTQGDFGADTYIVTAGAWSSKLLGAQTLQTDIKPIRGQMLLFKFDTPPLPYVVLREGMYLIPRRDGHLLVGSTLEDVGFDESTTAEARDMLLQRAAALLPELREMPVVKHWAGLRPGSPGNIPTIGRHPHLQNLYINSGHFRYGVTMAPASVEVLLNEMNGTPQFVDVAPYRWR